ncbi:BQ5605_C030g10861 [Microbotryum silenes-dioicae]|uniref:BQ5605_C030g10861 protein n=1 Tax=Microbotryum silenes-dioicae TaxID=796604 RepID=A0A2X0N489_9BASI|nr:BQ5605_C030g10861 [Microbotryum silenes-dioicae]
MRDFKSGPDPGIIPGLFAHLTLPTRFSCRLTKESAYDLVDHDWITSVFRAIGAPERFIGFLSVIYTSVSLRYIINGHLRSEAVCLLCGLGQEHKSNPLFKKH